MKSVEFKTPEPSNPGILDPYFGFLRTPNSIFALRCDHHLDGLPVLNLGSKGLLGLMKRKGMGD